ncbi:MAG: DNA-primase RepB domain-containing protein [Pseudomonadota bacterium]
MRIRLDRNVAHLADWIAQQGRELIPEFREAERFLQALDPTAEYFSFRTFSDSPYTRQPGRDPLERAIHGGLRECWDELTELSRRGAAVCVTINRTNGKGREVTDIEQVRALFLDDDNPPENVDRFPLSPQIQVKTSAGHYHHYWLTDNLPLSAFTPLQRELACRYGGDQKVQALNQTMQLPGLWRRKQLTKPQLPTIIKNIKLSVYSKNQLEKLLSA